MSREAKKNGKVKLFNLTEEEINLVEQMTRANKFSSQSEFIGFVVRNYSISKDPLKELEQIKTRKTELNTKIKELEEQEADIIKRMKAYKEFDIEKKEWENKAIDIIVRKIKTGETLFDLEDTARYWGFRLNMDAKELIYKATLKSKLIQNGYQD
jgi:predicted transcriptional regulator